MELNGVDVRQGDCLTVMKELARGGVQVDAVVTDPPYGIGFMGRSWDAPENVAFHPETWRLVFDLMKPGAHLFAFGGTRTYHRMVCAIEDAGFEIRDQFAWVSGQGFPKSHDVSKAIAKTDDDEAAKQWQGWGTTVKPAWEPIVLARKPLIGTVAENVLEHGTGALNIDGCRVDAEANRPWRQPSGCGVALSGSVDGSLRNPIEDRSHLGRFPANLVHDGSEEVTSGFPREAERFFYCAKASKADRAGSRHPTVKPVSLIRWLVRMITPPGGVVLDPFAGSGTTGAAAVAEGKRALLIEREPEYVADIIRRMESLSLDLDVSNCA